MLYIPYAALLAAFVLIHLPRFVVGREMAKLEGGYDNRDPRTQQLQLVGRGKRALSAHNNGFEAFAPFAIAVLACAQRGPSLTVVAALCIGFVVVRTVYIFAYLADNSSLRSGMWTLGTLATSALFVMAIIGG